MKQRLAGQGERGVALLVALLVVALVTLLVAGLLDRGELSAARTRNSLRAEQAQAYAQGLEKYAARILQLAQVQDQGVDSNNDIWSIPLPPTPVPGGSISARMRDLNGCFNLNNLVISGAVDPRWKIHFDRLLSALQLDPSLSDVVIDWLDADSQITQPGGAEDAYYLAQPLPYRAANRNFAHVSELRLLKGMNDTSYRILAPHVCALPPGSALNVNTATVPVLRTLTATMTEDQATRIWNNGQAHYLSFDGLNTELKQKGIALDPSEAAVFGTQSSYFLARGDITLDELPFTFFSVIERRSGGTSGGGDAGIRVLSRSSGSD